MTTTANPEVSVIAVGRVRKGEIYRTSGGRGNRHGCVAIAPDGSERPIGGLVFDALITARVITHQRNDDRYSYYDGTEVETISDDSVVELLRAGWSIHRFGQDEEVLPSTRSNFGDGYKFAAGVLSRLIESGAVKLYSEDSRQVFVHADNPAWNPLDWRTHTASEKPRH